MIRSRRASPRILPGRWVVGALVLTASALGVYAWRHWSGAPPTYAGSEGWEELRLPHRLRNAAEHDAARARSGGEPYVLEIPGAGSGAILYYGASHTRDPGHPQIADIEARWRAFEPTVALCEGRARGYFHGALIEPFAGLPEPALVHKLARRDGIPMYSLEPPYEDEVAGLLREFPPEHVALYFFLRVYASEAGGAADERLAADLLEKRTDVGGLRGALPSIEAVDGVWEREFAEHGEWRTLTSLPGDPLFSRVDRASRRIRGEHMVRVLTDLALRGERVFAVVGSGHVIRQEWNLRALFGMEPAWDQPGRP